MSTSKQLWIVWADETAGRIEGLQTAVNKHHADPADIKAVETITLLLHSLKGLLDAVGLHSAAIWTFEIEQAVHALDGRQMDAILTKNLEQACAKLHDIQARIRASPPESEEVASLDEKLTSDMQPAASDVMLKAQVTISPNCEFQSARAMAVLNILKRLGTVVASLPSMADLLENEFAECLVIVLRTTESVEHVKRIIQRIPGIEDVQMSVTSDDTDIEATIARDIIERTHADTGTATSDAVVLRVPISDIRAITRGITTLSTHVEALRGEVSSLQGLQQIAEMDLSFDWIQTRIRQLRHVPFDSVIAHFPKMVSHLAKQEGKKADLTVSGRLDTIDRGLATLLIDPLTIVLRNSVIHGIENPGERRYLKKPETGRINVRFTSDRAKLRVEVSDDGRGIDLETIERKAVEAGLEFGETFTPQDALDALFKPGFTTKEEATLTSGRGLGLFTVKDRLAALGGTVTAKSESGKGLTITFELNDPDAMEKMVLFTVGEQMYAIQATHITEVMYVDCNEITREDGRSQGIYHTSTGELPILLLQEMFEPERDAETITSGNKIVLQCYGTASQIGLLVDQVIDERLLNVRPMNPLLRSFRMFDGSVLIGGHRVVFVINPSAIV